MSSAYTAWVIYRAPEGYAPAFCARHFLLTLSGIMEIEPPKKSDDLDELRAQMPKDSVPQPRGENDPALIVETWI